MNKQVTRRIILTVAIFAVAAVGVNVFRTSRGRIPTVAIVNYVSYPILDESIRGIKAELAEEGFKDDRIHFIDVNANGQAELLNTIAQEVVSKQPSVIVPVSTPVTQAIVKVAGTELPIVYSTVTNPDDVGMSNHPSNMTGVSDAVNYSANVELIHELFPSAKTIGIIYNPGERNSQFGVDEVKKIAPGQGLEIILAAVSGSAEVADATNTLAQKVQVFYIGSDNTVASALTSVVSVANEHRIPVIASDAGSVEQGALAAVSVDYERVGREAGKIVARILTAHVAPGSIPNVYVKGVSLILNDSAAKKIGYAFPENVRRRASKILP